MTAGIEEFTVGGYTRYRCLGCGHSSGRRTTIQHADDCHIGPSSTETAQDGDSA